jgi:hypothetical protein
MIEVGSDTSGSVLMFRIRLDKPRQLLYNRGVLPHRSVGRLPVALLIQGLRKSNYPEADKS